MYKINSFIITFCAALILSTNAFASDCSPLNENMKKAYDNANKMAVKNAEIITKPDFSFLEDCLGGLSGSLGGFTLPGIPNLNDLLNQACEAVVDAAYDKAMASVDDTLNSLDLGTYNTDLGTYGTSGGVGINREDGGLTGSGPTVEIQEPDIDLHKSIDNIFN